MLPKTLIKGLDKARLRNLLVLLFLALGLPTAFLIWQAYSQLKWEAFHQYRGVAEELTRRIDSRLDDIIRIVDARSFADFTFLVVTGDPSANFVQRSPLSIFPVEQDLPGNLGYFQIDSDGTFSTPLLPPDSTPATSLGIGTEEYRDRADLAREIQEILADNQLVVARPVSGALRSAVSPMPEEEPATIKEAYGQKKFDQQMFDELSQIRSARQLILRLRIVVRRAKRVRPLIDLATR